MPPCQGQPSGGTADIRLEPRDVIYAMFIPPEWEQHDIRAMDTPSQWLAQEAQEVK